MALGLWVCMLIDQGLKAPQVLWLKLEHCSATFLVSLELWQPCRCGSFTALSSHAPAIRHKSWLPHALMVYHLLAYYVVGVLVGLHADGSQCGHPSVLWLKLGHCSATIVGFWCSGYPADSNPSRLSLFGCPVYST